ncbi:hypothetical protein SLA2020_319810 [Shorea laevis]
MLRTLRSRRRPRYGAQVCAVISAFLLLLSVSLLHSRLSLSSKPHIYQRQSGTVLPTNPLLSDSDDDFGGVSTDDKIDELDTLEESDPVSNEDEIEQEQQETATDRGISSSGQFYFDHITGTIRRSFNKRSIEEWDYDYVGFNDGVLGEDSSDLKAKAAFASDDIPVDEEVRRKMSEVVSIEDALLLKIGKRESPLREKWGDWFDKKGDFLRRDRMFKSHLEVLNPLNNPLLQDPDIVGISGLTRGDKMVQKWLLSEFKRVPFTGKKPLEGTHDVNFEGKDSENERNDMAIGEIKRRTLDDNLKNKLRSKRESSGSKNLSANGGQNLLDERARNQTNGLNGDSIDNRNEGLRGNSSSGSSNRQSELRQVGELKNEDTKAYESNVESSGHIYADGKRWGYYPGMHPRLSFTEFIDIFFRKGKCDIRVFMVWNSPSWMYNVRHQRGLESLLSRHPNACVVLLSETIELDFFKESFVKDGYKVAVAAPNLDELLKDTPAHVFASVWFEWRKTKFYAIHYSELVRLAALYKFGGIYLDSDIIVLRPLSSLKNSIALEDQMARSPLNGAVMAFEKHSSFVMECLKEFYLTYDDTQLRWNGADLLTRVARKFLRKTHLFTKQLELNVQPSFLFFPLSSHQIARYFVAPVTEIEKVQQDTLFKKILNESLTFHFWNSFTSALIPEPGSLVARLIDHPCIHCSDKL